MPSDKVARLQALAMIVDAGLLSVFDEHCAFTIVYQLPSEAPYTRHVNNCEDQNKVASMLAECAESMRSKMQ